MKATWGGAVLALVGICVLPGACSSNGVTASLDDWLGSGNDPDYLTTHVIPHDQIAAIGTAVYASANFLVGGQGFADPTFPRL